MHHIAADPNSITRILSAILGGVKPEAAQAIPQDDPWAQDAAMRLEAESFWRERLSGLRVPSRLPSRLARPSEKDMEGVGLVPVRFKADMLESFGKAAASLGVGLSAFLSAAWLGYLSLATGEGKVATGYISSGGDNRPIGPMAVMLPLAADAREGTSFAGLAREVEASINGFAMDRERILTYTEIARVSPLGRETLSHLFFPPAPKVSSADGVGFTLSATSPGSRAEGFPLSLFWLLLGDGLALDMVYERRHFEPWQLEVYAQGYETLLRAASENPSIALSPAILLEAGKLKVLINNNAAAPPRDLPAVAGLALAGGADETFGAALFLKDRSMGRGELRAQAAKVATVLRQFAGDATDSATDPATDAAPDAATENADPGKPAPVALVLDDGLTFPGALLGCLLSGRPALLLDPSLGEAELGSGLAPFRPFAAMGPRPFPEALKGLLGGVPGEALLDYNGDPQSQPPAAPDYPLDAVEDGLPDADDPDPSSLALIFLKDHEMEDDGLGGIVTSRRVATGVTQLALSRAVAALSRAILPEPGDLLAITSPKGSDLFVLELLFALSSGNAGVIASESDRSTPATLAAMAESRGVTVIPLPPMAVKPFLSAYPGGNLRLVWARGPGLAWAPPGRKEEARLFAGKPDLRVIAFQGGPETGLLCMLDKPHPGRLPDSFGEPLEGSPAWVLGEKGGLLAPGYPGELSIGGETVPSAYLGDPPGGGRPFAPDPALGAAPGKWGGTSLYLTGFLGRRRPDGRFDPTGKVGGRIPGRHGLPVDPARIARTLSWLPNVLDAFVAQRDDSLQASFMPTLCAYLVMPNTSLPGAGSPAESLRLERGLLSSLWGMMWHSEIPSRLAFVTELPLDPYGEVDIARLPAPVPLPDEGGLSGPAEKALLQRVREALGLAPDSRPRPMDSFLDLGGDSLHATMVTAGLLADGWILDPGKLLSSLDLREAAGHMHPAPPDGLGGPGGPGGTGGPSAPRAQGGAGGEAAGPAKAQALGSGPSPELGKASGLRPLWAYPPGPYQLSLMRARETVGRGNRQRLLKLAAALDPIALGERLGLLSDRHEALRLRVLERDGEPLLGAMPEAGLPFAYTSLSSYGPKEALERVLAFADGIRDGGPPDGPLFRVDLFETQGISYLLISYSELALDGYGLSVVVEELLAGRPPRGTPKPLSSWMGEPAKDASAYLREALQGVKSLSQALPPALGDPDPGLASGPLALGLSDQAFRKLRNLSRNWRVRPELLAEAAFATTLSLYSGEGRAVYARLGPQRQGLPSAFQGLVGQLMDPVPIALPTDTGDGLQGMARGLEDYSVASAPYARDALRAASALGLSFGDIAFCHEGLSRLGPPSLEINEIPVRVPRASEFELAASCQVGEGGAELMLHASPARFRTEPLSDFLSLWRDTLQGMLAGRGAKGHGGVQAQGQGGAHAFPPGLPKERLEDVLGAAAGPGYEPLGDIPPLPQVTIKASVVHSDLPAISSQSLTLTHSELELFVSGLEQRIYLDFPKAPKELPKVGLFLPYGALSVACSLAILRTEATLVTLDPKLSAATLSKAVRDGLTTVIGPTASAATLSSLGHRGKFLDLDLFLEPPRPKPPQGGFDRLVLLQFLDSPDGDDRTVAVIHGEGLGALGGGVAPECLSYSNALNRVGSAKALFPLRPGDRALLPKGLGHLRLFSEAMPALAQGACLCEHECDFREGHGQEGLHAFVRDNAISFAYLPARVGKSLLGKADLPKLRALALGGRDPGTLYAGREGLRVTYVYDRPGFPALHRDIPLGSGEQPMGRPAPGVIAFVLGAGGNALPRLSIGRLNLAGPLVSDGIPRFHVPDTLKTAEDYYETPPGMEGPDGEEADGSAREKTPNKLALKPKDFEGVDLAWLSGASKTRRGPENKGKAGTASGMPGPAALEAQALASEEEGEGPVVTSFPQAGAFAEAGDSGGPAPRGPDQTMGLTPKPRLSRLPEGMVPMGECAFLDLDGHFNPLASADIPSLQGRIYAPPLVERRIFAKSFLKGVRLGTILSDKSQETLALWLFAGIEGDLGEGARQLSRARLGIAGSLPPWLNPAYLIISDRLPLDPRGEIDTLRLASPPEGTPPPPEGVSGEAFGQALKAVRESHKALFGEDIADQESMLANGMTEDDAYLLSKELKARGAPAGVREIMAFSTPWSLAGEIARHLAFAQGAQPSGPPYVPTGRYHEPPVPHAPVAGLAPLSPPGPDELEDIDGPDVLPSRGGNGSEAQAEDTSPGLFALFDGMVAEGQEGTGSPGLRPRTAEPPGGGIDSADGPWAETGLDDIMELSPDAIPEELGYDSELDPSLEPEIDSSLGPDVHPSMATGSGPELGSGTDSGIGSGTGSGTGFAKEPKIPPALGAEALSLLDQGFVLPEGAIGLDELGGLSAEESLGLEPEPEILEPDMLEPDMPGPSEGDSGILNFEAELAGDSDLPIGQAGEQGADAAADGHGDLAQDPLSGEGQTRPFPLSEPPRGLREGEGFALGPLRASLAYRALSQGDAAPDQGIATLEVPVELDPAKVEEALGRLVSELPMLRIRLAEGEPLKAALTGPGPGFDPGGDQIAPDPNPLPLGHAATGISKGGLSVLSMERAGDGTRLRLAYGLFALDPLGAKWVLGRIAEISGGLEGPSGEKPYSLIGNDDREGASASDMERARGLLSGWEPVALLEGLNVPDARTGMGDTGLLTEGQVSLGLGIDQGLSERIGEASSKAGVSVPAFMAAAWGLSLARWLDSGQGGFGLLVGKGPEGPRFVPMLLEFADDTRFSDAARVSQELIDCGKAGLPPLPRILGPGRAQFPADAYLGHIVVMGLDEPEEAGGAFSGRLHPAYDLALHLVHEPKASGFLEFNRASMPEGAATLLRDAFLGALRNASDNPDLAFKAFSGQRDPNPSLAAQALLPGPAPALSGLLVGRLSDGADTPLLAMKGAGVGRAALWARAREFQEFSGELGNGQLGAVLLPPGPDLVAAIVGLLASGAAVLPLDPFAPRDAVSAYLSEAGPELLIAHERLSSLSKGFEGPKVLVRENGRLSPFPGLPPEGPPLPGGAALLVPRGPLSGRPALIAFGGDALSSHALWLPGFYGIGKGDRVLAPPPFSPFFVPDILAMLLAGAECLFPGQGARASGKALRDFMEEGGVAHGTIAGALAREFLGLRAPGALRVLRLNGGIPVDSTGLPYAVWSEFRVREAAGPLLCARYGDPGLGRPVQGVSALVLGKDGSPRPQGYPGELCVSGPTLFQGYLRLPEESAKAFARDPGVLPANGRRYFRTSERARILPDGSVAHLGGMRPLLNLAGRSPSLGDMERLITAFPGVFDCRVLAAPGSGGSSLYAYVIREGAPLGPEHGELGQEDVFPYEALDTLSGESGDFDLLDMPELSDDDEAGLAYEPLPVPGPSVPDSPTAPEGDPARPLSGPGAPEGAGAPGLEEAGGTASQDAAFARGLRDHLGKRLPAALVPRFIVTLPRWPIGPDGELDEAALPRPYGAGLLAGRDKAPRSLSEAMVSKALKDALGGTIYLNDSFVALGGDSLKAVEVSAALSHLAGVAPGPEPVLHARSARELAAALDLLLERVGPALYDARDGGGPQLALCPGPAGSLMAFRGLMDAWPEGQGVLALNPWLGGGGRDPEDGRPAAQGPDGPLADLAGAYARALAERFPQGGFVLAGLGLKGPLAWEAARQYEGLSGARLSCLLLLDPLSPPEGASKPEGSPESDALALLGSLGHYEGFGPKRREGRMGAALRELGAWRAHRPRPLSSPVLCLRPALASPFPVPPPGAVPSGLSGLAKGPFAEETVQADHFSLIQGGAAGQALRLLKGFAGI
ncbi:MAG: AMP-binding protein [Deltaproteobacteria bacterium]|nr:AMP-binding protein [Deltaproteobacteria bacterium]